MDSHLNLKGTHSLFLDFSFQYLVIPNIIHTNMNHDKSTIQYKINLTNIIIKTNITIFLNGLSSSLFISWIILNYRIRNTFHVLIVS